MFSQLKAALQRALGGGGEGAQRTGPTVEYKGYRITPTPYKAGDQFQTSGTIEKDTAEGVKRHEFIRADTYASWEDAVAFTTSKAKQIIDQQGDRIFR